MSALETQLGASERLVVADQARSPIVPAVDPFETFVTGSWGAKRLGKGSSPRYELSSANGERPAMAALWPLVRARHATVINKE